MLEELGRVVRQLLKSSSVELTMRVAGRYAPGSLLEACMSIRPVGKWVFLALLITALACTGHPRSARACPQEGRVSEIDTLAHRLLDEFSEADKRSVAVMDLQPAFGQDTSLGSWLAEGLSSSLQEQDRTISIVERPRIGAVLLAQHLALTDEWNPNTAAGLGTLLRATTVVIGSYGATDDGIGITLVGLRVSEHRVPQSARFIICTIFGKIPITQDVKSHLSASIDSLRPSDGVYRAGFGGVSLPVCVKCGVPMKMTTPDIDLQGMLRAHPRGTTVGLRFVVSADGHTRNIVVTEPVGYGFDEQYVKAVEGWELKPAVDPDNRPVSAIYDFHLFFNFK
jgi:hypothetical protein